MCRTSIPSTSMRLPPCATPRPGERVKWYNGRVAYTGELVGHRNGGRPCILNIHRRYAELESFDYIRLDNPFERLEPNWARLSIDAQIVKPLQHEGSALQGLLNYVPLSGPNLAALVDEIWNRGFEVFLVGDAVKDVIDQSQVKGVRLATTMPLKLAQPVLKSMYGSEVRITALDLEQGEFALDPYVTLEVFKDLPTGTGEQAFGADFVHDMAHRDFTFNSVYYDPINAVLIDPSGSGIEDAEGKNLHLVTDPVLLSGIYMRVYFFHFLRYIVADYLPSESTLGLIDKHVRECLRGFSPSVLFARLRMHVLSRHPKSGRSRTEDGMNAIQVSLERCGLGDVWHEFFVPLQEEMP